MVLINTKVSVANPQFLTVEEEIENYVKLLGVDIETVLYHKRVGEQAIEAITELAGKLARDFPLSRFVLRPHPHERLETYSERFGDHYKNLEARKEGTVDAWILKASALIHRHCSTAVEASLAGVPALSPQWVPSSQNAPDAEDVSVKCRSYEELKDIIQCIQHGRFVSPPEVQSRLNGIIDKWLYKMDGNAHIRVSQAVLNSLPDKREVDKSVCRSFLHSSNMAPKAWSRERLLREIKRTVNLSPNWSFRKLGYYPIQTGPPPQGKSFTCQRVQKYVDRIQNVMSLHNITYRPVKVALARSRGGYMDAYQGHSVVMYTD
jgi:hypothetical protein